MDIEKWLHFRRYSEALEACDEALRLSRPVNSLSKLLHTHKLLGQPAPLDNLSAVYLNVMRL